MGYDVVKDETDGDIGIGAYVNWHLNYRDMNRRIRTFIANMAYSPIGNKMIQIVGAASLYAKYKVWSSKKDFLSEAKKEFGKESAKGNLEDFKQALKKHWVSYNEYANQYEFYKKSEEERNEYVSRLKMAYFYWRYTPGIAKSVFRNKTRFLKTFNMYVHRKWLYAPESSYEEFAQLVSCYDCIVKPCDGKLGKGIFKTYMNTGYKEDNRKLYESCVKDRMLVEQCIESCEELRSLHPQSLNTIRVVTISNKEKACVFSGVLRTGVGDSVVDNSHKGGISAQINIENGIVETDGANTKGEQFTCHPDSEVVFKGFKIPKWNMIVETVCEAAKLTDNPITGWDVVLNNQGKVEFVEANYGPDMDMMQTRYKAGAKKKIYSLIKEYCGIELK